MSWVFCADSASKICKYLQLSNRRTPKSVPFNSRLKFINTGTKKYGQTSNGHVQRPNIYFPIQNLCSLAYLTVSQNFLFGKIQFFEILPKYSKIRKMAICDKPALILREKTWVRRIAKRKLKIKKK